MEVFLYNSTVCRLCGEENDNGNLLYSTEENDQNLSQIINTYLPITVTDDGHLPRTICPGCTIQLEASVEFLNLIINGQKVLRELYEREKEYKKSYTSSNEPEVITEKIIYEINTGNKVYQLEHPISLQVAGLEKPKRKRGRPPKIQKSPEELAEKDALKDQERAKVENNDSDGTGKRRRKTPTRFKEVVQGKELERIFKEEGMTDGEDSDSEKKVVVEETPKVPEVKEPQVIGHLEQSGELVVVLKGKGRGRPKGRLRQTREQCMICGMEFSSTGRYMSHIAQHGPVLYQCAQCQETFATRLRFCEHQERTSHCGQNILQCKDLTSPKEKKRLKSGKSEKIVEQAVETTPPVTDTVTVVNVDSIVSGDTAIPDVSTDMDVITVVTTEESNKDDVKVVDAVQESNSTALKKTGAPAGDVKTKLKCNHCDKEFSSRQAKSMHNKAVHQGEKPYQCGECGAAFGYPRSLALHRVSHRRHRRARGYACDLCGKVLSHPSSVVYHKQSAHAEQRYVCGTCGKHFRHKQLLQRHQLVHSQLRPFRCKLCNSSFKTKANLANHQMLHSGVKKFSCEICKQKFSHKTSHTLHMRWHTGVKPFECGVCGKSFSQKGNLSEHERIHTGEKPYQCALCSRRFTTSSQHRLHLRRHAPDRDCAACPHCAHRMPSRGMNGAATGEGGEGGEERCPSCGRSPAERPAPRTQQRHLRRIAPAPPKPQASKQISLLVSESEQMTTGVGVQAEMDVGLAEGLDAGLQEGLDAGLDAGLGAGLRDEDEDVVYIAYHLDEPSTSMQFNRPEELYASTLPAELPALHHQREHLPVTDEQGNLLHFTMQDGTRLAITSPDGECLQVVMQDGQTIPVEINGFDDEKDLLGPETVVHQLNLQKSGDSKTHLPHYYTLV